MAVLEMQSPSRPSVRWTEVCTTEHEGGGQTPYIPHGTDGARLLAHSRSRSRDLQPSVPLRSTGASGAGIRSCRGVSARATVVVDDVPTWVLLACGVLCGIVLMLLLAFVGGPAYA